MNTIYEHDIMADMPVMKPLTVPTIQKYRDSKHQWKLTLIKDNGGKIIRYCSSKKNGLAVGRMIHGAKTRPTKMFSVTKA